MDNLFWLALALALVIEGLIPALFPNKWKAYVVKLAQEPADQIRTTGCLLVAIGIFIYFIVAK